MSVTFTAGIVRPGISAPSPCVKRPDLCADHEHPGVTYNPWQDKTWCLCGKVIREGDHGGTHAACCEGPLVEDRT